MALHEHRDSAAREGSLTELKAQLDLGMRELQMAREREAATAEILRIISSSPTDTQPVFDAIVQSGLKLFPDALISVALREGDTIEAAAVAEPDPARVEAWRHTISRTPLARDYMHGAALLDRRIVDVPDAEAAPAEFAAGARNFLTSGYRAITIMPMMRGDEAIGLLSVVRLAAGPLSDEQLAVLRIFANQAVIAIENTRLLNELHQRTDDLGEALEQQTATAEILGVISSSLTDTQPVFDAIVESAVKLFPGALTSIALKDGDMITGAAAVAVSDPARLEAWRRTFPYPCTRDYMHGRAILDRRIVDIPDVEQAPPELAVGARNFLTSGYRAITIMPMVRGDAAIGALSVIRVVPGPLSDKQIAVLKAFAAQAVIAIENTRLLNELRQRTDDLSEALEQQTATSEVLQVISSSPGELEPVFKAMLENAIRICGAGFGNLWLREGEDFRIAAIHGAPPAYQDYLRREPVVDANQLGALSRVVSAKQAVQVADIKAEPIHASKSRNAIIELAGGRTLIAVPMLKDGEVIGAFNIYRQEVRPFSEKQIELVSNFAAQAVIAIENARLLSELRARTEELEQSYGLVRQQASQLEEQSQQLLKMNEHLEQRVSDQVNEIERMGKLRRFLPPQVADLIVSSGAEKQLESHRREITALFCDLRGFTGFSESSDPEDVMALLREYHSAIGKIIFKHGGTLERFAGDGVMVIFNDPVPLPNPALAAVQMALEMRTAISALVEKWSRLGHDLGFGIGISHGYATLGTIGFEGRFDYAAIGTVSNVAARLCDEAQPGQILISPRVLMAVEDAVSVEPAGEFTLKGIRRPLSVYNVIDVAVPQS